MFKFTSCNLVLFTISSFYSLQSFANQQDPEKMIVMYKCESTYSKDRCDVKLHQKQRGQEIELSWLDGACVFEDSSAKIQIWLPCGFNDCKAGGAGGQYEINFTKGDGIESTLTIIHNYGILKFVRDFTCKMVSI